MSEYTRREWAKLGLAPPLVLVLTGAAQRAHAAQAGSPPVVTTLPPAGSTTLPPVTTTGPPLTTTIRPGTCPLSQGYWKTHPEAWPASSLRLGTVRFYSQQECLALLAQPSRGDASLILAKQLIAAKLNGIAMDWGDAVVPMIDTIEWADSLIGPDVLPMGVGTSTPLGQDMTTAAATLEAWNTGGC